MFTRLAWEMVVVDVVVVAVVMVLYVWVSQCVRDRWITMNYDGDNGDDVICDSVPTVAQENNPK